MTDAPDFVMDALASHGLTTQSLIERVNQLEGEHQLQRRELERLGQELQRVEFEKKQAQTEFDAKKQARKPKATLPAPMPPGTHRLLFDQAAAAAVSSPSAALQAPWVSPPTSALPPHAYSAVPAKATAPTKAMLVARIAQLEAELARRKTAS
jgi:hypothetical protein